MIRIDRRQAMRLLAGAPVILRSGAVANAQTRASANHRVVTDRGHGLLLEPDGGVQIWHTADQRDRLDALLGLGPGSALAPYTLARVPGLTGIVAAAAGASCSFVIKADGALLAWGINGGNGRLGTTPVSFFEERTSWGPDANVPSPLAVPFDATAVSTQTDHTLALTRDGRVFAWGTGDKGQLGIGPMPVIRFRTRSPSAMPYSPYPIEIPGLSGVAAVSAGVTHSVALMRDGTVRAWGENRWGEVGDGSTTMRPSPVAVQGVHGAVAVAAGQGFSAALRADGTVMTWGNRFAGALGHVQSAGNVAHPLPTPVPGVRGIRAIAAGSSHVLALTETGSMVSWGQPDFGAVGRRNPTWPPGPIPSLSSVQSITANGSTSIAVLASGRIMTWGSVRPWTRAPEEGSYDTLSHLPILLWLDGLQQP